MIRKEGKARWVYTCDLCKVRSTFPDEFRALEKQQRHLKSEEHAFALVGLALQPFVDAYTQIADAAARMVEAIAPIFATPKNLPHDPSLLRDRRKWGGR